MTYVDCPKTNFKYLVICYLKGNKIEDYSQFETGLDMTSNTPTITRWEYEIEQPTVDYLIDDRYPIYKRSIKIMKQDEARELYRQSNYPWVAAIQKIHFNKNVELNCLQALYPELFVPEVTNR
jgi:hypothetical protein